MRHLYLLMTCIVLFSCRNTSESEKPEVSEEVNKKDSVESRQTYTSEQFHFSTEIPQGIEVYEGQLPGETPVINFYPGENQEEPPYAIHNDAASAYIAVLPEGYGVDAPAGPRASFADWKGRFKLSFEANPEKSFVYLLENGDPWAMSITFYSPPPGWGQYPSIFVFYKVEDFRAECFSSDTGKEIPLTNCDPMDGDSMKFFGDVDQKEKALLDSVLENLYFNDPERPLESIENLIRVDSPQPGEAITSPLKITGEAKGYWFFEASAPVSLYSESGENLGGGYIQALGDWMTENWVPFESEIEFETNEKRGYVEFNRANASGKPEHDRVLRIPVVFD